MPMEPAMVWEYPLGCLKHFFINKQLEKERWKNSRKSSLVNCSSWLGGQFPQGFFQPFPFSKGLQKMQEVGGLYNTSPEGMGRL